MKNLSDCAQAGFLPWRVDRIEAKGPHGVVSPQHQRVNHAETCQPGRAGGRYSWLAAGREELMSRREPTPGEWSDLGFAWAAVFGVKSNAILLAKNGATIGIGAGQMSRVDSSRIAVQKAADAKLSVEGAALASDAFFPFRDGVDAAAAAGVQAIIQPGGSMRDEEVVAAADDKGIAMVFTGRRHFRQ